MDRPKIDWRATEPLEWHFFRNNCRIPCHIECVSEKGWLHGTWRAEIVNSRWWCIYVAGYVVRGENKFKKAGFPKQWPHGTCYIVSNIWINYMCSALVSAHRLKNNKQILVSCLWNYLGFDAYRTRNAQYSVFVITAYCIPRSQPITLLRHFKFICLSNKFNSYFS